MLRILLRLVELRVQALAGHELTKKDKAVVRRHTIRQLQATEEEMNKIAEKVYKERIKKRYAKPTETQGLSNGTGSRPQRELSRGARAHWVDVVGPENNED